VSVLEYVAAIVFAGTFTLTLTSMRPSPVAVAAFRIFVEVGVIGTARFASPTELVGRAHVEPVWQAVAMLVIFEAFAGRVLPAAAVLENYVELSVRFQPPPVASPRASTN
jgi:hypothetical protein